MRETTVLGLLATILIVLPSGLQAQMMEPVDLARPGPIDLALAADWAPGPLVRSKQGGRITKAPFWCSACASESGYAKGATPAGRPETLLARPAPNMLATVRGKAKHAPVVCATERLVVVCHLKTTTSRGLNKEEKGWIKDHFGKLGGRLGTHRLAHLWMLRALKNDAEWRDLMCVEPGKKDHIPIADRVIWGVPKMAPGELWLFAGETEYREFSRQFCRFFGVRGHWWYEKKANLIATLTYGGKEVEKVLPARVAHLLAHHRVLEYRGFYSESFTWVTEGLGHWFERRFKNFDSTFCKFGSPLPGQKDDGWGWAKTRWWREVKSQVKSGEVIPMQKLATYRTDKLDFTGEAHAQAWSMVTYMLGFGKQRWRLFIDVIKGQSKSEAPMQALNRAFQRAYGHNAIMVHKGWQEWVRRTRVPKRR